MLLLDLKDAHMSNIHCKYNFAEYITKYISSSVFIFKKIKLNDIF